MTTDADSALLRADVTTDHAGYAALAELTNATLVTCDARLGNVRGTMARTAFGSSRTT